MTARKTTAQNSTAEWTPIASHNRQPVYPKTDDAQLDHLVSIARQLRSLSSDLEHWNSGESKRTAVDEVSSPFAGSVDDSIFQLANSYERQLVELSMAERPPWTVPLRHLHKSEPAPSLSLPPPIDDSHFNVERSLRTSLFNYDFDANGALTDDLRYYVNDRGVMPQVDAAAMHTERHGRLLEPQDNSYEKLLSVLTFPIDLEKTSRGLVRLHEKYIKPLLDESVTSDNVSMIKILETERHKLIEKIDQLLTLSKGTLTDDLNTVYLENNENIPQTIAKLTDKTKKDTKSVMLSMAVHLQIYAECLIDIAHTIVNAEVSNRIRMQFFKCMANEESEKSRGFEGAEKGKDRTEEEKRRLFHDIPSFTKDGLSTFDSLVTDEEIEDFALRLFEAYDQHKDAFQMNEEMFYTLERFVDSIAVKLENEFTELHKPPGDQASGRVEEISNDERAHVSAVANESRDTLLARLLDKNVSPGRDCPTCRNPSDKRKKIIGSERLADLQDYILLHPEKFSRAEKAVTNYYAWLLRKRDAKESEAAKQRGMWLTYKNVHDFLHGGKLGEHPIPDDPPVLIDTPQDVENVPEADIPKSTALPLFLPPTIVNAGARADGEPRSMSSLIENIQIARSDEIQEVFSSSMVKILNNSTLDAKALGLAVDADAKPTIAQNKCCSRREEADTLALDAAPDDELGHLLNAKVKETVKRDRGSFDATPYICWPILFLSIPQDRLRKIFESITKLKPNSSINENTYFPSHLHWIYPSPEAPLPKHVLQMLFRIGLEKIIQILEKNRLMSDSILLPRRVSDEPPFQRVTPSTETATKRVDEVPSVPLASATVDANDKPITSVFDILTHFSSNPFEMSESEAHMLKDNFYVPPTKQHLIEQLEWNFVNILWKSSDIYKCLIFGAGAIKGHRLLSRNNQDRTGNSNERSAEESATADTPDSDQQKAFPFSYANLRELYEQVFVIGLQHCLQQLRPRLLKQIYNDVRKTCEAPKSSEPTAREDLSAEKQIQYIVRRIVPREEAKQRMKMENKTCQCVPGDRDLQYQPEGSWILVPSPKAPCCDTSGPSCELVGSQNSFIRGGADTLTGKIRMRLRGLHILRSRAFLSVMPVQGRGRTERGGDTGSFQFPYRFYSPTFFFAGKYWSILTMINRIKHKNYLSLYLCCVDTVYCHFGFVLLNLRNLERTASGGEIAEGDILHEGHQLFDKNTKENDYGFSNIVELQRLFSPDAGFYDVATDSCLFDTIITVYGEKRTDSKSVKTHGVSKVKESSTHPTGSTKEKVENIIDIMDGRSRGVREEGVQGQSHTASPLIGSRGDGFAGRQNYDKDGMFDPSRQFMKETYQSFVRNRDEYNDANGDASGDEACPTDSDGSVYSQYYVGDNASAAYHAARARQMSEAYQDRSKQSAAARQKLLEDDEREKKQEQRKKALKRIKLEKSKLQQDERSSRDEIAEQLGNAYDQLCSQFQKKLQILKKNKKPVKEEPRAKQSSTPEKAKKHGFVKVAKGPDQVPQEVTKSMKVAQRKPPSEVQSSSQQQKKEKPPKVVESKAPSKVEETNDWMCKKSSKAIAQPKSVESEVNPQTKQDMPRPKQTAVRTEKNTVDARLPPKGTSAERSASKKPSVIQHSAWTKTRPIDSVSGRGENSVPQATCVKPDEAPSWPVKSKGTGVASSGYVTTKNAEIAEVKSSAQQHVVDKGKSQATVNASVPVVQSTRGRSSAAGSKPKVAASSQEKPSDKAPSATQRSAPADVSEVFPERIGVTYAWRDDDDESNDFSFRQPTSKTLPISKADPEMNPHPRGNSSDTRAPKAQSAIDLDSRGLGVPNVASAPPPPILSGDWSVSAEMKSPQVNKSWNAIFGSTNFDHQALPSVSLPTFSQNNSKEPNQQHDRAFLQSIWKGQGDEQSNASPKASGFSFFSILKLS